MDLEILWFILIAVLFVGFFFLEGFDFGVGILLLLLGKKDDERRSIINTIGPFWDGNEVWLITAGGAMFAAFPHWYATMFSGFYLALLIMLVALIFRGVYFEFRSKRDSVVWRGTWDIVMFICSFILSILWGVALANLIKGVPIDKNMNYVGSFLDLISVYTVFAGITTFLVFTFHGSIFLSLKSVGVIKERALKSAKNFGLLAAASSLVLIILTQINTDLYKSNPAFIASILALIFGVLGWVMIKIERSKLAFFGSGLSITLGVASLFLGLFPRVMVSSLKPEYSLTIYNAASSSYTLSLMTKVALVLVPIVLAYQIWTYWIFRKRVTSEDIHY